MTLLAVMVGIHGYCPEGEAVFTIFPHTGIYDFSVIQISFNLFKIIFIVFKFFKYEHI